MEAVSDEEDPEILDHLCSLLDVHPSSAGLPDSFDEAPLTVFEPPVPTTAPEPAPRMDFAAAFSFEEEPLSLDAASAALRPAAAAPVRAKERKRSIADIHHETLPAETSASRTSSFSERGARMAHAKPPPKDVQGKEAYSGLTIRDRRVNKLTMDEHMTGPWHID